MNALVSSVVAWLLVLFIAALEFIIITFIWTGKINVARLISDENGDASLSRFQLLIFTFVIAMSLFYIIVNNPPAKFPDIPEAVLLLLGISGGSYVLSKGIAAGRDTGLAEIENQASNGSNQSSNDNGNMNNNFSPPVGNGNPYNTYPQNAPVYNNIPPNFSPGYSVPPVVTPVVVNPPTVVTTDINSVSPSANFNQNVGNLQGMVQPPETSMQFASYSHVLMDNLHKGMSGGGVLQLQQKLNESGFHCPVSSSFDEETEAALIAFQESVGLAADGVAGPSTLEDLGLHF